MQILVIMINLTYLHLEPTSQWWGKPCVPRVVPLAKKGFFPNREPKNRQAKKPSTDDKGGPEASAASGAACHREDRLSMQKTFSCPEFRRDFSLSLSFSPMLRLRLLAIVMKPFPQELHDLVVAFAFYLAFFSFSSLCPPSFLRSPLHTYRKGELECGY
ncbi:hypothetical protein TNIN_477741 [Trichonephila inaurata madagascariensis]|uniref:Uncharacterized protein n=1 Tax=Trichonephila inaurata madagascariensis TaxID=2747483 RepID=A0A8X6XZR6_9ARAC|nr:hypothetical protein TNIN_477741 [Trichonephila inaurata madagascariensis]